MKLFTKVYQIARKKKKFLFFNYFSGYFFIKEYLHKIKKAKTCSDVSRSLKITNEIGNMGMVSSPEYYPFILGATRKILPL